MVDTKKLLDKDLYELLGLQITATEGDIRKAYRKKALECHPDKNPDNPKAAELFHELSKALEILSDESARAAYDKVLKGRQAAKIRTQQLDSKRKKFKEDLELREKRAQEQNQTPEEALKAEIERLRTEGSKLVEEEQLLLKQKLIDEAVQRQQEIHNTGIWRVKIKWSADKKDETNGGYTEDMLRQFLKKYGNVTELLVSAKKRGSALAEFETRQAAEMAIAYEVGVSKNPLKITWVTEPNSKSTGSAAGFSATVNERDYESLVLRQMRQAEERKRLIEEMLKNDD